MEETLFRVAILDIQPIDPPMGGGRMRILGLYHDLGEDLPATYLGSYDWPGESYRRHHLSRTLEEIDVPLSKEHFAEAAKWQELSGGKTIIDTAFPLQGHLSHEFVDAAKRQIRESDIVVFSHPWVFPLLKDVLEPDRQLLVYESHNVEGQLRRELLGDNAFAAQIADAAVEVESELCHRSDLILACSHDDRRLFGEQYGVPVDKIYIAPNGVFTSIWTPPSEAEKLAAKRKLGLTNKPLAVFLGSSYGPNIDAARFIISELAPAMTNVNFAVCGGVCEDIDDEQRHSNVHLSGRVSDGEKWLYFAAADLAINPVCTGSGTNVKMFDFMATGLPTVSTPVGARGIAACQGRALELAPLEEFKQSISHLLNDNSYAKQLGATGRRLVEEKYSWERISRYTGTLLQRHRARLSHPKPFFSVIVPTYERHDLLVDLLNHLRDQQEDSMEIIVIDQSEEPFTRLEDFSDLDLFYVHTDLRGAVKARNTGASLARGEVLAFTDDDTQPRPDWLANSRKYFENADTAGVEGRIVSAREDDPRYRPVTNRGLEGIGFMTANLLLRRRIFCAIDGFDEAFDLPHFREDTDLGWRALEHGHIPFGDDVVVYHPPHLRESSERESHEERARFFEKDALLMRKHPDRYRALFQAESHYRGTPGFWPNFVRGIEKYDLDLDEFLRVQLTF